MTLNRRNDRKAPNFTRDLNRRRKLPCPYGRVASESPHDGQLGFLGNPATTIDRGHPAGGVHHPAFHAALLPPALRAGGDGRGPHPGAAQGGGHLPARENVRHVRGAAARVRARDGRGAGPAPLLAPHQ
eukprot:1689788-Pyramimonas_sp.AAC.1